MDPRTIPLSRGGTNERSTAPAAACHVKATSSGICAWHLVAIAAAAGLALSMFITAPKSGEFWWSDAPRHALNGVFLADVVRDLPLGALKKYAIDYYLQYPALTILFYPPLLYAASAPFFLALGESHWTAQIVVSLFHFALAWGAYVLARRFLPPPAALATALLLAAAPEIALWGRQTMLEIPAFAFLLWALVAGCRYADSGRPGALYLSALLLVAGIYTKLSLAFAVPVLAFWLLWRHGFLLLRRPHVWAAVAGAAIGLAPLIVITVVFGQANVQSVSGVADATVSRTSLSGWTWYLEQLPSQIGWMTVAAAAIGLALALRHGKRTGSPAGLGLMLAWFLTGYLFYSAIDLKEARHSVFILFPVCFLAAFAIHALLPGRIKTGGVVSVALASAAASVLLDPVPAVAGYRAAAEFVASRLPEGGTVLFSGKRDGSFIFNVRELDAHRQITVIRADKLLLRVAIRRELGVETKDASEAEIADMIRAYGVSYVVAQRDFWTDLPPMARLQSVLESGGFEEVARISVQANVPTEDRELRVYRNPAPLPEQARRLRIELPAINQTFSQ